MNVILGRQSHQMYSLIPAHLVRVGWGLNNGYS